MSSPSDALPQLAVYWLAWSSSCIAASCLPNIIIIHYHFRSEKDEGGLKNNSVFGRALVCFDLIFMLCTFMKTFFFFFPSLRLTVDSELSMMHDKVCGCAVYFCCSFVF